jgi:nitrogen fixation protein FixH
MRNRPPPWWPWTSGLYVPYSIVRWPGGDVFAIHLGIYLLASLACGMLLGARAGGKGLHWGPAVIGGFFIFVAVSGAVFVSVAERGLDPSCAIGCCPSRATGREVTSMFPGVISHDFHKKEALYNQYLQQVERQRQRGWQVQKGWLSEPIGGQAALFRVAVRTREGAPVTGATVAGQFLRPSTNKLDVDFTLAETAPGVYEVKTVLLAGGRPLESGARNPQGRRVARNPSRHSGVGPLAQCGACRPPFHARLYAPFMSVTLERSRRSCRSTA